MQQLLALGNLLVIVLVAYQIGKVAVGEAHQHHVAVVVGVGGVALAVVDAVEHEKRLHNLLVVGILVGEPQITLKGALGVVDAVVEKIARIKQRLCRGMAHGVALGLRRRKVFLVEGYAIGVVGIATRFGCNGSNAVVLVIGAFGSIVDIGFHSRQQVAAHVFLFGKEPVVLQHTSAPALSERLFAFLHGVGVVEIPVAR